MLKQGNLGIGNQNNSIEVKDGIIIINSGTQCKYTISELWEILVKQFNLKDQEINKKLPDNVLINKTQRSEPFNSSKIISSLMKIGIPLPATIEIVDKTILEVEAWLKTNSRQKKQLTTKIIRQFVSSVIQELDTTRWTRIDIEDWNAKYVRRYGHNNRIIQIYAIPPEIYPEPVVDISYDFVRKVLLADVIETLFPHLNVAKEVSAKNSSEMAEEIIAFINNCDLYSIDYTLLKNMVREIATQLPHPWFICVDKRRQNIEYDRNSVLSNLDTANDYYNKEKPLPSTVIVELLHHSSSMVLEKYFSFLGCYDLTAFYRLVDIVTKLTPQFFNDAKDEQNSEKNSCSDSCEADWDIVISDYSFKNLFDDCTIAGIDLVKYREKAKNIASLLSVKKSNSPEFTKLLIDFANWSLDIQSFGDKTKIVEFLSTSWSSYTNNERCENIKALLLMLCPHRRHKTANSESLHFWITYNIRSNVFEMKSKVFVIVANDEGVFDYSAVQLLSHPGKRAICNTILMVSENIKDICSEYAKIQEQLKQYNIDSHYIPIFLCKNDLKALFDSKDRVSCFDNIIENQLDVESY